MMSDVSNPGPRTLPRSSRRRILRRAMLDRFSAPTLVVDITYRCNALCRYCRWGDAGTLRQRSHQDLETVLADGDTLRTLGTRRVVLSGGEPRLHPEIGRIIGHYAGLADDVIIITNGYGLVPDEVRRLACAGATGITLSLDSTDPAESMAARATTPGQHRDTLYNLGRIASGAGRPEMGINATVSHATARWATVRGLLELGRGLDLDFVKFQPVFDDGYTSANAPELLLGGADAGPLREIAAGVKGMVADDHPLTNPPGFWTDVAELAAGGRLPGGACGLGPQVATLTGGNMGMCYWVKESRYDRREPERIYGVQDGFESLKPRCTVDPHCFCTQRIDHVWVR